MTRWISPGTVITLIVVVGLVVFLMACLIVGSAAEDELDRGMAERLQDCDACGNGQHAACEGGLCACAMFYRHEPPEDDGDDHEDVDADVLPFPPGRCPTCKRDSRPASCCRVERLAAALQSDDLDPVTRAHLSDALTRATERKPTDVEVEHAMRRWGP